MMKAQKWLAVTLAVLTVLSLAVGVTPSASAADVNPQTAQQVVSALGIMVGDEKGNMNLDAYLTRSQMAKVLVKLSGSSVSSSAVSPFPDVPYTNWAAPYVSRSVSLGYINGYPDGTFKPDKTATLEEMAKTLLAVLGYTSTDYGVGWPWAQINYAQKLGLLNGVTAQVGAPVTRRDVMLMVYNTLGAVAKSGKKYITVLGYSTTSSGDIDVSSIIGSTSVGPITAKDSGWLTSSGLNTATLSVYLNDKPSSLASILPYDIVYYSVSMNTVWAYDKKVTGILQNVLPSRIAPTSAVVSGTSYTLSGSTATTAASYLGGFSFGDAVTLLFDRNGSVADIVPASVSATVMGYVTAAGSKTYTAPDGGTYNGFNITLVTVDGSKLEYQFSSSQASLVGQVVAVGFANGTANIIGISSSGANGTVSYSAMTLGSQKLSPSVRILDVDAYGNYITVFPQRLDGVTLSSSNVLFSQTDALGAVTQLILKGVTGDTSSYGVLTEVKEVTNGMSLTGTYTYNVAGTTGSYRTTNILFNVQTGPAYVSLQGTTPVMIKNLTSLGTVTIASGDSVVSSSGVNYLLSDKVTYFEVVTGSGYMLITGAQASGKTLTAYYDKAQSEGGRIRVIIAQ